MNQENFLASYLKYDETLNFLYIHVEQDYSESFSRFKRYYETYRHYGYLSDDEIIAKAKPSITSLLFHVDLNHLPEYKQNTLDETACCIIASRNNQFPVGYKPTEDEYLNYLFYNFKGFNQLPIEDKRNLYNFVACFESGRELYMLFQYPVADYEDLIQYLNTFPYEKFDYLFELIQKYVADSVFMNPYQGDKVSQTFVQLFTCIVASYLVNEDKVLKLIEEVPTAINPYLLYARIVISYILSQNCIECNEDTFKQHYINYACYYYKVIIDNFVIPSSITNMKESDIEFLRLKYEDKLSDTFAQMF